ncbi:hypothetical protein [Rhizobium sp. L1K21]|uniref:hypothetical protein n=1 Tax=Rhizobium sp. L1K21 TaxID=2954933 RepID=UPI0020927532|nr:hypothetical protein [Rhizobium sp. L1K21]MCO6186533.1 hypothetical protein [Rhizobium sp. L1K21]
MIGVSSRISASFSQNYTVNLFQSASVEQTSKNSTYAASAAVSGQYQDAAARAIDSILNIVQQANGNTSVGVATNANVTSVETDKGNDDISVIAARAYSIGSGAGNDTINIRSERETIGVFSGEGNDTIDIDAGGNVGIIAGGDGNDTISIKSGGTVAFVNGGEGNDTLNIEGENITLVTGGSGNDTVNITNNGERAAQYYYFEGDGKDTITSNGPVEINLFNEDGTSRQDMADAKWSVDGNTVSIAFADGGSISVNMEGADKATVSYDANKGSLVINAATTTEAEALKGLG